MKFGGFVVSVVATTPLAATAATLRVPFGSFGLSFLDVTCEEKPWEVAEQVRSGAEDCLRAFGCSSSSGVSPFFIGLGNAVCENDQVVLRGGVMQFEDSSSSNEMMITTDAVETCVREVLTSGKCTAIFQDYLPEVDRSPTYITEHGLEYYPAADLDAASVDDVLKDAPDDSSIKSTIQLPVIPLAAASAGALLLIGLSTFIVFRKKRVANDGFANLGSHKSVLPVSTTLSTTEADDDVEMGTSLTLSDSLVAKRSPALGEMLDKVFSVSSLPDDCAGTPDTTKISTHLESSTFSDDEEDRFHHCSRDDYLHGKVSLTQRSYDTRLVVEDASDDDEKDDEDCPVIAIPSFDLDSSSTQLPPSRLLTYNKESVLIQPNDDDATLRFRSFSNATEEKGRTNKHDAFSHLRSNSLPNIHQGTVTPAAAAAADRFLSPSSDDELSQEDPELAFFNEQVSHPSTCLDDEDATTPDDDNEEDDSMLELVTESSSVVSDQEFEPDLYWNPDDTSVTVFDAASMAVNGTGEFSFHANLEREAHWSTAGETNAAGRHSATSLPVREGNERQQLKRTFQRRKSTSYAPL